MPFRQSIIAPKPGKAKQFVNSLLRSYLNYRYKRIRSFIKEPVAIQTGLFKDLIHTASGTVWGRSYDYAGIKNYQEFSRRVPVQTYEDLYPFILRMMRGEANVLWPGVTKYFSKSSGTTNDKSKYIPVSEENMNDCHIQGGWDTVVLLYHLRQDAAIFLYKNIILPGSVERFEENPDTLTGDISALMIHNMPAIGRAFYVPDMETALLPDWEEKIEKTAQLIAQRDDIGMFGGVPTWNLILFRRVLELSGKQNLLELWPNLQVYFHGGVGFAPYRKQFQELIPSGDFSYMEIYNASEGFFAIQNDFEDEGMLLLLDNGIFYEFMPLSELDSAHPVTLTLKDVEMGTDYAMLISTNSGLWRYQLGDTVRFTSLRPFKIVITGRTKQFINVFGEELMVHNAEKALALTTAETGAVVAEYTVGPVYIDGTQKGGHHWVIEFEKRPQDLEHFADLLDKNLQKVNSDYAAKRFKDMALTRLRLTEVPKGSFVQWMKSRNKFGAQNKIPRLSNSPQYVEALLDFVKNSR